MVYWVLYSPTMTSPCLAHVIPTQVSSYTTILGTTIYYTFCDVEGNEENGSSYHKVHQESNSNRMETEKIVVYLHHFVMCDMVICTG